MVTLLAPAAAKAPTYVKVTHIPGLYRHALSDRYYACKKLSGIRRESSLDTSDRKIAERRMKEWLGSLDKVDAEVEKTTLGQLIHRCLVVTGSMSKSSRTIDQSIIKKFLAFCRTAGTIRCAPSALPCWTSGWPTRNRGSGT